MRVAVVLSLMAVPMLAMAAPELIVDIDFNDEVYVRPEPMTQAQVAELVENIHASGCQTIIVRMGFLGLLPYRTNLSYPIGMFDEKHARSSLWPGGPWDDIEKFIEVRKAVHGRYAKVLEAYNPPEVFIREGHKRGMKVIMWIDIFDDLWPGYRSKFLEEHPYCQWTARDGKTYFKGLMSYAWPEARAFRVKQAEELLNLGADGIHCSTSAHCRHLPNVHQDDFYGFEQPIVDEYKKRYGVDIRTAKHFNERAWHVIKGEAMNQLYRELAQVCHARGKELWVGLQLGDYTNFAADPYFGTNVVARYANNWKELVDEGIADAFILADYELPSKPDVSYWQAKHINLAPGQDLFAWAAQEYGPYCRGKTALYLFVDWLSGGRAKIDESLAAFADRALRYRFDGVEVHEALNFESDSTGWDLLKRCSERLRGRDPGSL